MTLMPFLRCSAVACLAIACGQQALAHGSVSAENDVCLIEIGYYKAHFKVYLPAERRHAQFCEDLPSAGRSVFIMEYVHPGLSEVPIDFRIIRNVTGQGRFTRLADIAEIDDLDEATVFHHPAKAQRDVFTVHHEFDEAGEYVGIVTLTQPETGKPYTAVFPFEVGFTGLGYWPLFALAAIVLQINYLWMSGRFAKWIRASRRKRQPKLTVVAGSGPGWNPAHGNGCRRDHE